MLTSKTVHLYNHTSNFAFKFPIHPATGNSCWLNYGSSSPAQSVEAAAGHICTCMLLK